MECNKDEALRAKEIAEKKFEAKDIAGAMRFASKAHNLYSSLDGIGQMISTLEVYVASEPIINGEKDLYGILSVPSSVDDDTLKKQYRKMALLLHPDKNKSIGAEGAFQLVSEAWNVLSDKGKRSLFDLKRGTKGLQPSPPQSNNVRSTPKASDGIFGNPKNVAKKAANKAVPKTGAPVRKPTVSRSAAPPPSAGPSPCNAHSRFSTQPQFSVPRGTIPNDTFWTNCPACKVRYEYLRTYIDQKLICTQCHEPFIATEIPYGANKANSGIPDTGFSGFRPNFSDLPPKFQWAPFSRTAGVASSTAAAQAANKVHETYEKVRRDREEAETAARFPGMEDIQKRIDALKRKAASSENAKVDGSAPFRETPSVAKAAKPLKKRRSTTDDAGAASGSEHVTGREKSSIDGLSRSTFSKSTFNPRGMEKTTGVSADFLKSGLTARQSISSRQLSHLDSRKFLIQKAKNLMCQKSEEWKSAEEAKSVEKEKAKKKQKLTETVKDDVKDATHAEDAHRDFVDSKSSGDKVCAKKNSSNEQNNESDNEDTEPVLMQVPDPDFHDFDKDRSERAFGAEQIWSTYDDEDGMPRYYVLIQKVMSLKPFKIRMSYLTSKSNSEFGSSNWVASGFPKTCGDFRVGRYEVKDTINIFSHKIKWEKCPRGVIRILPRKGEIWALYRNWSPDWNEHTPDDVIYEYDMIEVLEDYNEEQGVSGAPLVKVVGFKTVFHRHLNLKEVTIIPREEMFRLSHQVPFIVLTGEEGPNAPNGCYELDPAATPLDLLHVITEAKDGKVVSLGELQSVNSL